MMEVLAALLLYLRGLFCNSAQHKILRCLSKGACMRSYPKYTIPAAAAVISIHTEM